MTFFLLRPNIKSNLPSMRERAWSCPSWHGTGSSMAKWRKVNQYLNNFNSEIGNSKISKEFYLMYFQGYIISSNQTTFVSIYHGRPCKIIWDGTCEGPSKVTIFDQQTWNYKCTNTEQTLTYPIPVWWWFFFSWF